MNQTERNLILELYSKTSDEILNMEIILYIRENQFCLVKRYLQYIDKFFQIVELTDDSFLVDFLNIERRCIVMNCEGQMVMSMIDDLEEMD
ncbi:hypothetical protein BpHYR1_019161 [Brachionus plicatilis]|uniref:Uncharacterized protein n=1 Tax=Brachionus plicatilis TaxID=10195 RepID=A0A3M7RXB3_BRAPC|nr:hypothetical protein BpHYR1_019161 [Brachionus plicatilis]